MVLILGVSTAWAEVEKQSRRELLPSPKCCCEKAACPAGQCCQAVESCPACAKEKASAVECRLRMICSIDFKDSPLQDVMDRFRQWSGINIVVDEPALTEAGVSLQRAVSLKLEGIPLGRALDLLLHQIHLSRVMDKDVVLVTSEAHARGNLIAKVYPVENLIPSSQPVVMAVSGSEPVFGWATDTPTGRQLVDEAPEESLVRLLVNTISPMSWSGNGGLGTVDYFPPCKSLVVQQTMDVHEQVAELLSALNRTLDKDVSVTAADPPMCLPLSGYSSTLPPAAPLLQLYAQPLPPPPIAGSPFSPPYPAPGIIGSLVPPACAVPERKAYVLKVEMLENRPDRGTKNKEQATLNRTCGSGLNSDAGRTGSVVQKPRKGVVTQKQEIAFIPEPSFQGHVLAEELGKENRKSLLLVKATPAKNDRMHLQMVRVQGKAAKTVDGTVAMELASTPLIDLKLKLGKATKVVLEKDQEDKPCKWMRVMVKEIEPAALLQPDEFINGCLVDPTR
jgi:hypothetical protein